MQGWSYGVPVEVGAREIGSGRCRLCVWAPFRRKVEVQLLGPPPRRISLARGERGYFQAELSGVGPGERYLLHLDGGRGLPDPASRSQPEGVHGPSELVGQTSHGWSDGDWRGLSLERLVFYELHVGCFTPQGTFEAVIPRLPELARLGVTALEIMPVAAFPGDRNWGYDGVHPFAVQHSYGGPEGLKRLVDACHRQGLAVALDVVYNHLGPEGNYLREYGPYFTDRYRTPWGEALNFDGPESDEVRNYFCENARQWFHDYHLDALRLDAVETIHDQSAVPFLQELAARCAGWARELGRPLYLIPESGLNDPRLIRPPELGGCGLPAQWSDDFHHALHVLLTGERSGYYADFGKLADLAKAYREGFVYDGRYSLYHRRRHGASAADLPGSQLVVCSQNHDQVGNRMLGERMGSLVGLEALKLSAAALLLAPCLPLLFMGQEYGEPAPFQYFVSHSDPALAEAVRRGRKQEFASFGWRGEPPDPLDPHTFSGSRLSWDLQRRTPHKELLAYHRELLRLRREEPALRSFARSDVEAEALEQQRQLTLRRRGGGQELLCLLSFAAEDRKLALGPLSGTWRRIFDSSETRWLGPGPTLPDRLPGGGELTVRAYGCAVYRKVEDI
jgi:maltooligosyltrehalose trehalohydrolase